MARVGVITINEHELHAIQKALAHAQLELVEGTSRYGLMACTVEEWKGRGHSVTLVNTGVTGNLVAALNTYQEFVGTPGVFIQCPGPLRMCGRHPAGRVLDGRPGAQAVALSRPGCHCG